MSPIAREMELFSATLDCPPDERTRFLETIRDEALRARVRELVAAHEAVAAGQLPDPESVAARGGPADLTGTTLGTYRLVELLGRGGAGSVYRAERESPKRAVAVKVLHRDASPETIQRFEHEAEILARLEHPGIASVFEAGRAQTPHGRLPYLALELIDGVPIDRYVHERGLAREQCIELLAAVCEAVAHAHVKGIVHRDLKPANVLVDRTGAPRIVDFGIARLEAPHDLASLHTRTGQILGTVPYMSPEQLSADPASVDTRTDVYALGVLAYELLSGRLPYDLSDKSIVEAFREIERGDAPRLGALVPGLCGDLELIVAKAICPERGGRYATAADLAADLRRFLADEPITARPPSATYHVRKLIRRNRAVFAGIVTAFVSLVTGLVLVTVQRDRARAAETARALAETAAKLDARRAAARATSERRVSRFLATVLKAASPEVGGSLASLDNALEAATERVELEIGSDAGAAGLVHLALARVRIDRAQYGEGTTHLALAQKHLASSEVATPADRVTLDYETARALFGRGETTEALTSARRALERARTLPASEHSSLITSLTLVAGLELRHDRGAVAESLAREALAHAEASGELPIRSDYLTARALATLGRCQAKRGAMREARATYERCVAKYESLGPRSGFAGALRAMSECCLHLRDFAAAEDAGTRAVAMLRTLHDNAHPSLAAAIYGMTLVHRGRGRKTEALVTMREAHSMLEEVFGAEDPRTVYYEAELGHSLLQVGQTGAARTRLTSAAKRSRKLHGRVSKPFAFVLMRLAGLELTARNPSAALAHAERAAGIHEKLGKRDLGFADAQIILARALLVNGKAAAAERAARAAMAIRRKLLGDAAIAPSRELLDRALAVQKKKDGR